MAKTKHKTQLKWKLEAKNFDDLKNEMIQDGSEGMADYVEKHIGDNHCKACVLASGMNCIHRKVCRIPQNEVWINGGIEEIAKKSISDTVSDLVSEEWEECGFNPGVTEEIVEDIKSGLLDQAINAEIGYQDENSYD